MDNDNLKEALKAYFGYEDFRSPQDEIIGSILDKRDVIGILPTGTGKSLCYQLPAVFLPDLTIVISPLVALMKDQVDILTKRGIPATALNSHLTPKQMRERIAEILENRYKVIYLAPEKLFSEDFREVFRELPISHIAVDEAHCISQWGHDFRPKYKKIAQALETLPRKPILSAFTATANEAVLEDIRSLLHLEDPILYKTTFDRPNLYMDMVLYEDKTSFIESYVAQHPNLGLVYCGTRADAERIHGKLSQITTAGLYHAGLTKKERTQVQEEFFGDRYKVLVATNAFGMGLDKENISYIIHQSMPSSLEAYYQEIGRGGRNGEPCECILLFGLKDVQVNRALGRERTYFRWRLKQKEDQLREMIAFTHARSCYRQMILAHFGETTPPCGHCGNCMAKREERDRSIPARKILSAIYHTKGYYGKATQVAILKGKRTAKIKERHLDGLTVFGVMKDQEERDIHLLLQELILQGYLDQTNEGLEERLLITAKGADLLKGEASLHLSERLWSS